MLTGATPCDATVSTSSGVRWPMRNTEKLSEPALTA
jgi:hypothetical protein